jgi:two-component system response regulator NreC
MAHHLRPPPAPYEQLQLAPAAIRVVIVDDHALIRRSLRAVLQIDPGIAVVGEADDQHAAIEAVQRERPDVLVLDLHMPGGSSLETIRRVREIAPACKIIVLTMEASSAFACGALDAGASAYLLKERAGYELPSAVQMVAAGGCYLTPVTARPPARAATSF